uniref:Uncharacterized protein n=1 Tax=Sphaerodactylus townsendi TaxID=933632 RepID=A0ACB8F0M6_9SAUR
MSKDGLSVPYEGHCCGPFWLLCDHHSGRGQPLHSEAEAQNFQQVPFGNGSKHLLSFPFSCFCSHTSPTSRRKSEMDASLSIWRTFFEGKVRWRRALGRETPEKPAAALQPSPGSQRPPQVPPLVLDEDQPGTKSRGPRWLPWDSLFSLAALKDSACLLWKLPLPGWLVLLKGCLPGRVQEMFMLSFAFFPMFSYLLVWIMFVSKIPFNK